MLKLDKTKKPSCLFSWLATILIPFLFLVGLFLAYLGILPLKVEIHTLAIVSFIFVVFSFFVKHNANYAVCHVKGTFQAMEEELTDALKENALTIMDKTKSTLAIKPFIAQYYQDVRNDNFARVAPSVFPMLGILGTFIAIALSMPDFTVENTQGLDREISLLLSGIGTAFYASIYGIMLSLIWTYFEKRGMAKLDKRIIELEKLYRGKVWTNSELTKHQHMQSELKNEQLIETLKETFNMDFIKELNAQYVKNFTTSIHETSESFTKLTHHMQEASSDLRETLDHMGRKKEGLNAIEQLQNTMEGFTSNTMTLQKSMEKFDHSVEHTFEGIDKELGRAVEQLSIFGRIISEQNKLILSNMATLRQQEKQ